MINVEVNDKKQSLILFIKGKANKKDAKELDNLFKFVDEKIEECMAMDVMIDTEAFPNWRSINDYLSNLKIINEYKENIKKVAVISDYKTSVVMPSISKHFVYSEIMHYKHLEKTNALQWLRAD